MFAALVGLIDMFIQRPGSTKFRAHQSAEMAGAAVIVWLMLNVPAIAETYPGAITPVPIAAQSTSCALAATGVPGRSPVASAASAVTVPLMLAQGTTGAR
jgi:hypothetical protein